ncbi:hypothetical protein ACOME3_008978 [Neoechinorhynchus agilis]
MIGSLKQNPRVSNADLNKSMLPRTGLKSVSVASNDDLQAATLEVDFVNQSCTMEKTKFKDTFFPPCDTSIYINTKSPKLKQKKIKWKRASDLPGEWVMYSRTTDPSCIIQGELGDCWLMSAMAVLCENPKMVSQIMLTKTISENGMYIARICLDGMWTRVSIDDYLPVNSDGTLVFSRTKDNQLWVPLVEKAVAKVCGSYEAIIKGHCIDGLMMLTGAPCETIFTRDITKKGELWNTLITNKTSGFLMSCACGSYKIPRAEYTDIGLEAFHAYSILDFDEYKKDRIIKLRNPWGSYTPPKTIA